MATKRIDYVCVKCGARDCKLWRDYCVMLNQVALVCATCAGTQEKRDVSGIDADGKIPDRWHGDYGVRTDQIGNAVPAVPTAEMDTYWGYTSVPPDRVAWWRALPSLPPSPAETPSPGVTPGETPA